VIAYGGSPKQELTGQPPTWRLQVIQALADAGLPLELHHDNWAQVPGLQHFARPTPALKDFYNILRTSTVNISLSSERGSKPYRGLKGLNVEIAAAGGMQISDPSDEIADILQPGRDIEFAESLEDFVAKARHYLGHPDEAAQMGRNSRKAIERHGGWEIWWARVASLLAERGVELDLQAAPYTPTPDESRWLATVYVALAHSYEANNNTALAQTYFKNVLDLDPDNYAAHTGMARLAGNSGTALPHWKKATECIGLTLPIHLPKPLALNGVGTYSTAFRAEAALNGLSAALHSDQPDEVLVMLEPVAAFLSGLAHHVASQLEQSGYLGHALEAVDIGLAATPEDQDLIDLRQRLAGILKRSGLS
jgi:tetratricopeptide (TPR) repeat protein